MENQKGKTSHSYVIRRLNAKMNIMRYVFLRRLTDKEHWL